MLTAARFLVICWHLLLQGGRFLLGRASLTLVRGLDPAQHAGRVARLKGRCLAALLRNLQATFIKIGQILSTRRDLFSPPIIVELETLQDRVPGLPFATIRRVIEQDLGRELESVFASFDRDAIAAGSIAQVHEARLPDGTRVAVKVQRPGIGRIIDRDIALLGLVARLAAWVPSVRQLQLPALVRELGRAIRAQLDFSREIANSRRFAANFADVDHVKVPPIFDAACGERVITMGLVVGCKLTDLPADGSLDRRLIAQRLIGMYHRMLLGDHFLHADLHPANILIDGDGALNLIDTGLVYEIPEHYVEKFIRVGSGLMMRNARLVVEGYLQGVDLPAAQREQAVAQVEAMLGRHFGGGLSKLQIGEVLAELLGLLGRNGIHLDSEWSGIILADLTFVGIAKTLDSEIDVLQATVRALPAYVARCSFVRDGDPLLSALSLGAAA